MDRLKITDLHLRACEGGREGKWRGEMGERSGKEGIEEGSYWGQGELVKRDDQLCRGTILPELY